MTEYWIKMSECRWQPGRSQLTDWQETGNRGHSLHLAYTLCTEKRPAPTM